MSHALCFNDVTLTPVNHDNQLWIRAAELARALGYASEKSVSNLYARNAEEFTNDMTVVIDLMTSDTPVKTRLFSPRGCHLIAMFARTAVAKAFRKWVLDVLDKLTLRVALPAAKSKKPAQKALPAAKQKTLLAPKLTIEEDIQLFAEEVRQAHAQTYAHRKHLMLRAGKIMSTLAVRMGNKVRPSESGRVCVLAMELLPLLYEKCTAALHSPSEHLDSYFSPESLLVGYAKLERDW